jgi:hypothetical protein
MGFFSLKTLGLNSTAAQLGFLKSVRENIRPSDKEIAEAEAIQKQAERAKLAAKNLLSRQQELKKNRDTLI